MSEQETVVAEVEFKTVGEYIEHLKNHGEEAVITSEVVETLEAIISRPVQKAPRRGQLSGLELADMTDEQLKRELINSKSVLYKATQRGASQETIAKNQARVDAAEAEKASRPSMAKAEKVEDETVEATDAPAEVTENPLDEVVVEEQHPVEEEL